MEPLAKRVMRCACVERTQKGVLLAAQAFATCRGSETFTSSKTLLEESADRRILRPFAQTKGVPQTNVVGGTDFRNKSSHATHGVKPAIDPMSLA